MFPIWEIPMENPMQAEQARFGAFESRMAEEMPGVGGFFWGSW